MGDNKWAKVLFTVALGVEVWHEVGSNLIITVEEFRRRCRRHLHKVSVLDSYTCSVAHFYRPLRRQRCVKFGPLTLQTRSPPARTAQPHRLAWLKASAVHRREALSAKTSCIIHKPRLTLRCFSFFLHNKENPSSPGRRGGGAAIGWIFQHESAFVVFNKWM